MARYRFSNTGITSREVVARLNIIGEHFESWNVVITGITMNPPQTTIDTDVAVTDAQLQGETFEAHLGFPLIVVST